MSSIEWCQLTLIERRDWTGWDYNQIVFHPPRTSPTPLPILLLQNKIDTPPMSRPSTCLPCRSVSHSLRLRSGI